MQTFQVVNVTKGIIIASEAKLAATLWHRIKGLLGQRCLEPHQALLLKPCSSIHTFFMRFAIDVLFLDKNMQVIRAIPNLLPNRLSPIVWASQLTIELPAGKIEQTNTQIFDLIELRNQ